jgi:hypothetical protein
LVREFFNYAVAAAALMGTIFMIVGALAAVFAITAALVRAVLSCLGEGRCAACPIRKELKELEAEIPSREDSRRQARAARLTR